MKIVRDPRDLPRSPRAVAIGSFDGVHIGHQKVLDEAFASGYPACVITFDPHPRVALGQPVELLTTLERRIELLAEYGVEEILVVNFDLKLAAQTAEQFAAQYLTPLGTQLVVAGPDFRFGHDRSGDLDLLRDEGFVTRLVDPVPGVSSTAIRDALVSGDVEKAAVLLGRPPELDGRVVPGHGRGVKLGFPTANLLTAAHQLVPKAGIYAGYADSHKAAVSIGVNPHFRGEELRIEAFLLDFSGDLYGRRLVVELWQRLRDEQTFTSDEELVRQIERDVEIVRSTSRPYTGEN